MDITVDNVRPESAERSHKKTYSCRASFVSVQVHAKVSTDPNNKNNKNKMAKLEKCTQVQEKVRQRPKPPNILKRFTSSLIKTSRAISGERLRKNTDNYTEQLDDIDLGVDLNFKTKSVDSRIDLKEIQTEVDKEIGGTLFSQLLKTK